MMAEKKYKYDEECRYAESDEWVRFDRGVARVGITDYAQSQLSDIVFVEFPHVGSQVEAGQAFGVVESVKAVSDLIAPISGEIVEVHGALEETPEVVNEDPYGQGWLVAIAPEDLDALDALMSVDEYRAYVKSRAGE